MTEWGKIPNVSGKSKRESNGVLEIGGVIEKN